MNIFVWFIALNTINVWLYINNYINIVVRKLPHTFFPHSVVFTFWFVAVLNNISSPLCRGIASNCAVPLLHFYCVSTHHVSEVWRQFLDLLELFYLLRVQVLLQLPRRLLIWETAPLNKVMSNLLQQQTETHCVCVCATGLIEHQLQ